MCCILLRADAQCVLFGASPPLTFLLYLTILSGTLGAALPPGGLFLPELPLGRQEGPRGHLALRSASRLAARRGPYSPAWLVRAMVGNLCGSSGGGGPLGLVGFSPGASSPLSTSSPMHPILPLATRSLPFPFT